MPRRKKAELQPGYNVAIVGATGVVGEVFLEVLAERDFPIAELYLLASESSEGQTLRFKEQLYNVINVADFDFSQTQFAFFSAGNAVSKEFAPKAAETGCVVIDNTSEFRYDPDIPLVIPEVNPEAIHAYRNRNIIANPNCSTIQMLVALKPIYDAVGIQQIDVATYQSVSGAGRDAIEELARQTANLLNGQPATASVLPEQIAFNVVPEIDVLLENGYTKEEMKMVWETHKILGNDQIIVNATAVRVPVFYGHSEAINIQTAQPIDRDSVVALLSEAPGIEVCEDNEFPTPITHAASQDAVFVGRIRESFSYNGLSLWVVADNVRKGAATNAVQIAELLIREQSHFH